MALASYLKEKFPADDEKLMMVYLRFNMFREYGSLLMKKATQSIAKASEKLVNLSPASPSKATINILSYAQTANQSEEAELSIEALLQQIIEQLSSAAEAFSSEECFISASHCITLCNLVNLQSQLYKQQRRCVNVLNMTQSQVRHFMKTNPSFLSSLIVAQAYDLHQMSEWLEPIYWQCIIQGRLSYFLQLRDYLPTSSNLFRELANKFKNEPSLNSKIIESMHRFCSLCADYNVRLEIMRQLGQLNSAMAFNAAAILDTSLIEPQQEFTSSSGENESEEQQ
jgi:spatacsin